MTTLAPTLSTRYFPRTSAWLKDLILIVSGSLLVALFAQIEIPLKPVPITGQTFAVLLVGAALGSKRGAAALALYLVEGVAGLPFFSGGGSGMGHIVSTTGGQVTLGYTGGYLIGFIIAAYVIGLLAERGLDRTIRTSLIPFLVGTLIIYVCGVLWLAVPLGSLSDAIAGGLLPFLVGDAIKLVAAALALPAAWKIVK
jgi:biotin transport system substrate-specific component